MRNIEMNLFNDATQVLWANKTQKPKEAHTIQSENYKLQTTKMHSQLNL